MLTGNTQTLASIYEEDCNYDFWLLLVLLRKQHQGQALSTTQVTDSGGHPILTDQEASILEVTGLWHPSTGPEEPQQAVVLQ